MKTALRVAFPALLAGVASLSATAQNKEEDYYRITKIPIPEGVVLEVGGIELLPRGRVAVSSRRGDIYTVEGAYETPAENTKWTLFAEGLHEPLGIAWQDGALLATQRPEVTKIKDEDGDGRADTFVTVNDGWGISGDYHEYAFGSRPDKDGNVWVVLCLTGSGSANSNFRGWCVRVTRDGKMIPTCSGIRSPGGIGENSEGDMFYSDNQGLWNGSSSLKHLKPGGFMANPTGNKYYELTDAIGPRPVDPKSGSRIEIETQTREGTRSASNRISPRQDGPIDVGHRLGFLRRKIRPLSKTALCLRSDLLNSSARVPGESEWHLPRRVLSFQEGIWIGQRRHPDVSRGISVRGWNLKGLGRARRQALCVREARLDGQGSFRSPRDARQA